MNRYSPKQFSVLIWEEEGAGRDEDSRGEGLNIIKVNYTHVRKITMETHYFVQSTYVNKK